MREQIDARPSIGAACLLILLATVGTLAAAFITMPLSGSLFTRLSFTSVVAYGGFFMLPIVVALRKNGDWMPVMRLNPLKPLTALAVVGLALASTMAASGVAELWASLLGLFGLEPSASDILPRTPRELSVSILTVAALPAVFEELLFRGVAFSAWEGRGTRFAMLASAGLFALMHCNVYGWPAYLLIGLVSSWLVFATGSLYAGIIYHTVYNAALLMIGYLLSPIQESAALSADAAAVGAGLESVLSVLFVTSLFAGAMAPLMLAIHRRARIDGIEPVPRTRQKWTVWDKVWFIAAVTVMGVLTVFTL